MPVFSDDLEIVLVSTHGRLMDQEMANSKIVQWAEIVLRIPKDFDFEKRGPVLIKKLRDAASVIGHGEK